MSSYEFEDEPYVVIEQRSGGVTPFLLGLAIGAGAALLFAPRTGAETRRVLRRQMREVRDTAEGVIEDVGGTIADKVEGAREKVGSGLQSARTAVEIKKQQVVEAIDVGRVAARQAREELERRIAATKATYQAASASKTGSSADR